MHAQCQCGLLSAEVAGSTDQIVACHCLDCQRRSGSPFGVMAYFPAEMVAISGEAGEFTRTSDIGNAFTTGFCKACGSTVWAKGGTQTRNNRHSGRCICRQGFPQPARSVWEQSMHGWVAMPQNIPHFPRGRT